MKPKMFRKGAVILDIDTLCDELGDENYIYLRDQPKHHGFIASMTLRTILGLIDNGDFYIAVREEKE